MIRCSITGIDPEKVKAAGVTGIKTLKHTKIMFADVSKSQMDILRAQGGTVERVQAIRTEVTVPPPIEGVKLFTAQELSQFAGFEELRGITKPPLYGLGMNVAIIDTGVRETHEQVNGRVAYSKNYTHDSMADQYDHGTGIASILLAVAPLCNILNLKVLDHLGHGTTEEVIEAIEDCIDLWDTNPAIAPVVINLSIGGTDPGNPNDPLRVACRVALENRIWITAAAGNSGPEPMSIVTPAVEKYVLCVGSANPETLKVSSFSSRGPTIEGVIKPDVVFFGENIEMASSLSDTAVVGKSGTSFPAPFCAGIAVLYLEATAVYGGLSTITREPPEFVGDAPPGFEEDLEVQISLADLIDYRLEGICAKPEGELSGKDNAYGYGVPLGTLMANAITGVGVTNISAIIPIIVVVGMMGIMMKTAGKEA